MLLTDVYKYKFEILSDKQKTRVHARRPANLGDRERFVKEKSIVLLKRHAENLFKTFSRYCSRNNITNIHSWLRVAE